jgi:Leucine-rich repeat (LRR) protein
MSLFKKLIARKDEGGEIDADMPTLWNYARVGELDEETLYTICRLIDRVGYQIKADWDWDWLKKRRRSYRSLLNRSLMNAAWKVLATKDWLSLQTTDDRTRKLKTIAPLEGLVNLRTLVLQNNLITDLQPLSRMAKLKHLNCFSNQITDLAPLRHLQLLERLEIGRNSLTSLSVLEQLGNLRTLSVSADQARCLATCRRLPTLQVLDVYGDEPVDSLVNFPEMPSLRVLRVSGLQSTAGIERFTQLTTLNSPSGNFSSLEGLEKLKGLTHLSISTSKSISLQPLNQLFAFRRLVVTSPNILDLSALARLPVLHEIHFGGESRYNEAELKALRAGLTPWDEEFRATTKKTSPSLEIEVVSQETFDIYDVKEPFGVQPGECQDGMFLNEGNWLLGELSSSLKIHFEEGADNDFLLPGNTGFRRSEKLALYSLRAYESTREIVTAVQQVLCESRNDWIIYFQSLLGEGPDFESLPADTRDFTAWIYSDKIVVAKEDAATVRKLIDWK